jgi:phage/plasmid-associated DNA primase
VLLGTAGSGKSTIAKALMMLVREQNVGQLPSNCEEQYAVASLVGKIMVMCTEMKEGFKLPINVLQCMISGDPVSVHAKFKDVFDKASWDSHIILVGNVIPLSWRADAGGAMERRAIIFRLDTKPATQDPTIQTRFYQNLGPFLVRITRAYRALVAKVNDGAAEGKFINDFVPRQVAAFHAMFESETSIHAALMDHLLVTYEIGFANALPPLVLTNDRELMELYRFMQDAVTNGIKRFPGLKFGQEKIQKAVTNVVPYTVLRQEACQGLIKEYRTPLRDLETLYVNWWKETNPTGRGTTKAPNLQSVLEDMGLVCSADSENRPAGMKFVFGIRRRVDDNLLDAMAA